jgi:2-polyprenyl-3-methyl-5-hydroxy-6-metoxy-1,4-benzoquinol methylase
MGREMNDKCFGPCPLCNGSKMKRLFSSATDFSEFHLVQCQTCKLTRTFPLPNDEIRHIHDIDSYYGRDVNKFNPHVQKLRHRIMRMRAKHYLSLIPDSDQPPKILDVGCAEGRLLKSFHEYGCQCWGIEHPSYPSQRFLNTERIVYLQGNLQAMNLPEGAFDLIFLWHTLEHMDDPQLIITRLYDLLAPRGAMIVAVPNFSSTEARRFKQFWFHLDIPWHKYHFNEKSVRYLIRKTHLKIIKISTLCFEQGPYGLLQSILNTMGWPKNEFYEALKGNLTRRRSIHVIIQLFIGLFLVLPISFVSLLTSYGGRGPVLKLILKKEIA